MASAPLRPRSARALTTAAAMAATATAQLTLSPPVLAGEASPPRPPAAEAPGAPAAAPAAPPPAEAAPPPHRAHAAVAPPASAAAWPSVQPAAEGPSAPAPASTRPPVLAPAAGDPFAPLPVFGAAPPRPSRPAAPTPALAPRAPAPDPPAPVCGADSGGGFPLDTELRGGPADYPAGGPPQEWRLDLTNTTAAPCSGVHPVLVLTDRERALRPEQIRFEFYDAGAERWRPVAFEATEEAENVGAFTGFGGFAVPPGKTLTVPVRLAFDAGTAPDEVVVNAAVVQRRGTDGDWVGESGDYRLTVGPAAPDEPAAEPTAPGTPDPSRPPGTATRPPDPTAAPTAPGVSPPDLELAQTGREEAEAYARAIAPLAAGLVLLGAFLVRFRRHRQRHR
ncbi:hypothetical protein ACFT8P_05750 [Streptomyces sp. NPDC057101]|uniref:hypothetical protein n=1 Tax=Streptomyces sp. NPDC057101 TaxID=3346020 RepID=UPI00363A0894